MAVSSQASEGSTSPLNGWDGKTSSTSSATRSVGKSSPTISPNPNPSTMSKPSMQLRFEDVYESFRVASHVSPLVQQESGPGHPTIDISGRRCLESFERLAPPMSWRRTFAASLVGMKGWFSTRCALTWKVKATKSARSYFLLQASTRRTAATEFGLLRTPSAQEPGIRAERLVNQGRTTGEDRGESIRQTHGETLSGGTSTAGANGIIANAHDQRGAGGPRQVQGTHGEVPQRDDHAQPCYAGPADATNANGEQLESRHKQGTPTGTTYAKERTQPLDGPRGWEEFPTVAPVCGGDDGLPPGWTVSPFQSGEESQ